MNSTKSRFQLFIEWLKEDNTDKVFSQGALRITVGLLGILLPISLVLYMYFFGHCDDYVLPSISDYFHSRGRSIFIGVLSGVCLTFFVFRGYNGIDEMLGKIASISCIGIMAFPTNTCTLKSCHVAESINELHNTIHFSSAAIFFSCLVIFSLFLFPLSYSEIHQDFRTRRMKWRLAIYNICGLLMFGAMVCIYIYSEQPVDFQEKYSRHNLIFWLETIMLTAFSISWLTKSQYWWPDEELHLDMISPD